MRFASICVYDRGMNPKEAIAALQKAGWTETLIANAVGTSQPTINRIKGGTMPGYDTGAAIVALADREAKPRKIKKAA